MAETRDPSGRRKHLDWGASQERLAGKRGRDYWRSLEELAASPEFQARLFQEFPAGASGWPDQLSRRRFLKVMGASLALAGLTACGPRAAEAIIPYVKQPEEFLPGEPLFFAAAVVRQGLALGVLAESHMGRPTKIEGNPDHPASLGATDPWAQAELLSLYDPDRSPVVLELGQPSTWSAFRAMLTRRPLGRGEGLRIEAILMSAGVTSMALSNWSYRSLRAAPRIPQISSLSPVAAAGTRWGLPEETRDRLSPAHLSRVGRLRPPGRRQPICQTRMWSQPCIGDERHEPRGVA